MQLIVADTGPINYLILIGHIDILPVLFEKIILPFAVKEELTNPDTPLIVRKWIAELPGWIDVQRTSIPDAVTGLGHGETAVITLAVELHAELLLMDDRRGVAAALNRGLTVTGTMGLLARAARHNLVNLCDAFERLKDTNFRYRQDVMNKLLAETETSGKH